MLPAIRRLQDNKISSGLIHKTPASHIPEEWGTVRRPDVFIAIANAAYETTLRYGPPLASNLAGNILVRRVFRSSTFHNFLAQSQTPPADAKPTFRVTSLHASFVQLSSQISSVQAQTQNETARYFGLGFMPVFSEQLKYDLPQLFNQFPNLIDEYQVGGGAVGALTRDVSFFRFQVQEPITAVDLRANSATAHAFMSQINRDPVVVEALRSTRNRSVAEGFYDLNDHTIGEACSAGIRMAIPIIKAILFSSAPALHQGSHRDNVAIFERPQHTLGSILPLDIVTITKENGIFTVKASSPDATADAQLAAKVIELGHEPRKRI